MLTYHIASIVRQLKQIELTEQIFKDRAARILQDFDAINEKLDKLIASADEITDEDAKEAALQEVQRLEDEAQRLLGEAEQLEREADHLREAGREGTKPEEDKLLPLVEIPKIDEDKTKRRLRDLSGNF